MISFLLLPPAAFEKFSLFFIKIRQPVLLFLFKLLFQLFIVLALPVIIQAGRHMVDHIFHSIGQLIHILLDPFYFLCVLFDLILGSHQLDALIFKLCINGYGPVQIARI